MTAPRVRFAPSPDRVPPRRRRPHGAVQLALRPPDRRHHRPPHRGHRPRAQHGGPHQGHPRRPDLARASPGTKVPSSRASTAPGTRPMPSACSPRARPTAASAPATSSTRSGPGGGGGGARSATTGAACRLAAGRDRSAGSRRARRSPSGFCSRTTRSPGTTRCTAASASRAATSTTSSFSGATAAPIYNLAVVSDDIAMRITPRDPRRRPHLQHAEADRALPRARPRAAGLRPRADDPRGRRQEALQAARGHRRGRLPGPGHPARRHAELPRPARLVARRRPRDPPRRRDDRAVLARGDPEEGGGVRHRPSSSG